MILTTNRLVRRGLFVTEVLVLVGLNAEHVVRRLVLDGSPPAGEVLYSCAGVAIGALALLRRRLPGRLAQLATAAIVLSLLCSLTGFLTKPGGMLAGDSETLALILLVGASCHQLRPRTAGAIAVFGGLAAVLAPVLRYGGDSVSLTVAVFWALLWGSGVAVGLILRDGEARREAAQLAARNRERIALAQELHDLVAHHITGVVVRTQAAQVVLADGTERELLQEIERAGADALGAVRRLVMVLRSPEQQLPLAAGNLVETIEATVDGDEAVTLRLAPQLADVEVAPETVSTVHRVLLESLTNVRKHAPDARQITVTVEPSAETGPRYLRVEVRNDGTRQGRSRHRNADGYGLIGMGERIDALDGRLTVGEHGEHEWRVLAELPLPGGIGPEGRTTP
ncbi:sensor histidine kinase [Kribbella speibonae]|uniref:histidine kinase n=1 Tax=Kribbella speibonae TaxID=1572660 RepID=A0A4R0J667_9ACTN|nr:histidine kinase [Kribbella speibonae]TCC20263.1 two-component sensor histidine kinase [Kribbella speibonae]TCC41529.1 two-component sensor histidine kinase [Kribbella speibonae]